MDYSKLSDDEINNMVGRVVSQRFRTDYCNNPSDAWPIIVANGISLNHYTGTWEASYEYDAPIGAFRTDETVTCAIEHKNPLRAAMIAFLLMQESQHA
ncbi:DUF2591 family protein [Cronobacter dublinensis]|nr:DUF2591 family protein [Cronobacter dublinensis]